MLFDTWDTVDNITRENNQFYKFALAKVSVGEPFSHLHLVKRLSLSEDNIPEQELLWRVGLYLNTYSATSAEIIWNYWDYKSYRSNPSSFEAWLKTHWKYIHLRRERRCVYNLYDFLECLKSWISWVDLELPILRNKKSIYREYWTSLNKVKFFGRYIKATALECLIQTGIIDKVDCQLSLIGNHPAPLAGLSLVSGISRKEFEDVRLIDNFGWLYLGIINNTEGIKTHPEWKLSITHLCALLCEYHSCVINASEYAGQSHDEELSYQLGKYGQYWKNLGFETRIWEVRKKLFPHLCLGELNGWVGIRKEPPHWLLSDKVIFSDLIYNYKLSVINGYPVIWTQ